MMAAVFVTNLIKRHPNCRVLLHRNSSEGTYITKQSLLAVFFKFSEIEISEDPFDVNELNPAKSGALESCLWELQVCVCAHVCVRMCVCVCVFERVSAWCVVCLKCCCLYQPPPLPSPPPPPLARPSSPTTTQQ